MMLLIISIRLSLIRWTSCWKGQRDICLDDFFGKNKPPAVAINPPITSTSGAKKNPTQKPSIIKSQLEPVVHHAVHLPKPQLSFKKKPDNSDSPWYPTLTHKYNAQVPLGYVYHDSDVDIDESLVANHPYRYEITHLPYPIRIALCLHTPRAPHFGRLCYSRKFEWGPHQIVPDRMNENTV
ncbi:hypothetical protein BYT27DRAFT_7204784 [Phlegmacium glaucopus]|nr:hypothetical protein BYT27DRAFT_7204784 [Phlegmacium glaucopus]